jgi:parallel beta-helix repeat protein
MIVDHLCHGIIVTGGGLVGLCKGNEVVGNSVYNAAWAGILIKAANNTEVRNNVVFNASQYDTGTPPAKNPGTYSGIDVRSDGNSQVVCDGTNLFGNTSRGSSQRVAFRIDPTSPIPTNTVAVGNLFLAGVLGFVELNGVIPLKLDASDNISD